MNKDVEFLRKLQAAFRIEAEEHLQAISTGLLALEKEPDPAARKEIVARIFREAHSLKGAARAVNMGEVESICQSVENVFAAWRHHGVTTSPDMLDSLHLAVSTLERTLPGSAGPGTELTSDEISTLLDKLAQLEADPSSPSEAGVELAAQSELVSQSTPEAALPDRPGHSAGDSTPLSARPGGSSISPRPPAALAPPRAPAAPAVVAAPTLRIAAAKLDGLLLQAEEMLTLKLTSNQRADDLRHLGGLLEQWEKEWAKGASDARVVRELLERDASTAGTEAASPYSPALLARLADFLDWNQEHVRALGDRLSSLVKAADHDRRATTGMVDSLLEDAKKLLMLPVSTLFEVLPRVVRDLSRDEAKEAELVIRGGDVEMDKRIIEEMKDPLIHLLRNAVDHGVEIPQHRVKQNKPPRATIQLSASQVDGNHVEIVVADDGAGIDVPRLIQSAIQLDLITTEEAGRMNENEAIALIFKADVSTSPVITEISGRGLGLPIVKEKVEKLGGTVLVETRSGSGTTFRLILPLTLATFRGILVESAGQLFVVPTANVERIVRIRHADVKTVENRQAIRLNDRAVSLVRLDHVLELPGAAGAPDPAAYSPAAVISVGDQRIAFQVDAVLNEQEVLVKRLGKPLTRVRNIAGATVLGSGKAVPILNAADLIKSASKLAPKLAGPVAAEANRSKAATGDILIVEDSITARMLLKSILESAGYRVKTAVDGMDGLTLLRTEKFDLVVSDVEMPRMNGFDLTAKVRADKRLANLPVILVTALASREDRERGVDAGANAYIVKASFDQSNLLDVVRRLI